MPGSAAPAPRAASAPPQAPSPAPSYAGYAYVPRPSPSPLRYDSPGYEGDQPDDDGAEEEEPSPWAFDLAANAQLPLSIGGLAGLELPGRLLVQGEIGWLPPFYGSLLDSILQGYGVYGEQVGSLVQGALDSGWVLRLSGGWRPFADHGFEMTGGYTTIAMSGSVSPADVAAVVGGDFAADVASQVLTEDITISSRLHNFHVALGWRWVLVDHLVLRVSLGYTQTLASSTTIETPELPEAGRRATAALEGAFDDAYKSYAKMPLLGLGAGYRF
jgi:hypothetical protein